MRYVVDERSILNSVSPNTSSNTSSRHNSTSTRGDGAYSPLGAPILVCLIRTGGLTLNLIA